MELLLSNPYEYLETFLLVFVRLISLLIAVPLFGNRNIPAIAKIGLAFFISMIIINTIDNKTIISSADVVGYGILLLKEVFVGWIIGFSAYLVYSILVLTGQFIDYQIGFSMVNVFDPLSQIQLTITGNLYYYMVMLLMIVSNAHHYFIRAIVESFNLIPIGTVVFSPYLYDNFTGFFTDYFVIALQIAAPFFFVMLLTNVVLGILARTAPQMNLFVIGFPLKILLGMFVLYITLNIFTTVSDMIINKIISFTEIVMNGMMP